MASASFAVAPVAGLDAFSHLEVVYLFDRVDHAGVVLDVKTYMSELGARGPVHQPAWSRELMAGYWG